MILTIGILVGATAFTGIVLGWFACLLYSRRILQCACGHAPGQGDRYTGICLGKRRERKYANGRRVWAMVACGCHLHGSTSWERHVTDALALASAAPAGLLNGEVHDAVLGQDGAS